MYISNFQPHRYGEEKASAIICVSPWLPLPIYMPLEDTDLWGKQPRCLHLWRQYHPKVPWSSKSVNLVILVSTLCCLLIDQLAELITFGFCLGKNIHSRYSSYTCWYLQIWGVGVWQGWYSSITLSRDGFLRRVEDADHKGSGMLICYVSLCNMYISHQWNNGSDPQSWTCCFLKSYIETSTDQNFPTSEIDIADVVMVQNHRTSPKWLPCQ